MVTLTLEIPSFVDEGTWEWRLSDEGGAFVADHPVKLDRSSNEYAAFCDLYRFVHWSAGSAVEVDDRRALVGRIADWIRREVWGEVGDAVVKRALDGPVTVHVLIPAEARLLFFLPLEIGLRLDPSRGALDVSVVCDDADDGRSPDKEGVTNRLRMLGIFSTPADQTSLNVRRERHEMRRLVHRVARAAGRAVELRTLQYGVTRELIEDVLDEGEGWDLIHFSGHGLPAGLVLEKEDGSADVVHSEEIADLLWPSRARLKLVTLSACESGAAEAADTLRLLGLEGIEEKLRHVTERADPEDSPTPLPALAQGLYAKLGCATLAMRYPVEDEFAISLSADLYEALLAHDQLLTQALQRALAKHWKRPGGPSAALSLATPALFGKAALDLRLSPPSGEPTTFDATSVNMAHFPPEPETFVGRAGPLARASAAFAPAGSHTAVLLHGMAGAGKTACALELAYRHRERRFEAMAWYSAPSEGRGVDEALTRFASDLQAQVEGLEIAHVINSVEKLKEFLPQLRRVLADRSVLIVLDNVETLLTPEGEWRDPRWHLLVESLVNHDGLSRLVLTSRVPPRTLLSDPHLLMEPIHTLSAAESVLLARQLPNLGALMLEGADGDLAEGRALVRRALQVVQGNPKLIELADAQAADPARLRERIADADRAWADHGNLDAFFATGSPDDEIMPEDFLRVIQSWATRTIETLPEKERLAFSVLCCLEDEDRSSLIVDPIWQHHWKQEHGEEATDPEQTLVTIARQGLVDTEPARAGLRFRLHPAVESAGLRLVEETLRTEIDEMAAAIWMHIYEESTHRNDTRMVVRACLGAAPYLLRQNDPEQAASLLGFAIDRDRSVPTLAVAVPMLERAAQQAEGTPGETLARGVLLRARASQYSPDVIPEMQKLRENAEEQGDFSRAVAIMVSLFDTLVRSGQLDQAEKVVEELPRARERADEQVGPWTEVSHEVLRLRLMGEQGLYEAVLEEIPAIAERMEAIGEAGERELAAPWNVRESLNGVGMSAALALQRWEQVLEFNRAIEKSEEEREAPALKRALTRLSAFGPLLELNRLPEAEQILIQLRSILEASGDLRRLGEVFGSWALLELRRGHLEDAMAFEYKALRHNYLLGEPGPLIINHNNAAFTMTSAEVSPEVILAHRLAAALIAYQTKSGEYPQMSLRLARSVQHLGPEALPADFEQLCERLDQIDGCEFRALFARLPTTAESGDEALAAVLEGVL